MGRPGGAGRAASHATQDDGPGRTGRPTSVRPAPARGRGGARPAHAGGPGPGRGGRGGRGGRRTGARRERRHRGRRGDPAGRGPDRRGGPDARGAAGGHRVVDVVLRRGARPRGHRRPHGHVMAEPRATPRDGDRRRWWRATSAARGPRPRCPPRSRSSSGRAAGGGAGRGPAGDVVAAPLAAAVVEVAGRRRRRAPDRRPPRRGRRPLRQLRRPHLALRLGRHHPRRPRAGGPVQPVPEPGHGRRDVHHRGRAPRAAAACRGSRSRPAAWSASTSATT